MNLDFENDDFKKLIQEYYKAKILHDIQAKAVQSFLPNDREDLELKSKRLEIVAQKKMLGIPLSDDDYEDAVNNERTFGQKDLRMMAVGARAGIRGATKRPLPSLSSFEKPSPKTFWGGETPKNVTYFGTAKPNIIEDLYGWIRRGVFRR